MADYGFPKETRRPVQTLTLDLPVKIGSVEDPTGPNPPIKVYGPYDADDEGVDLDEYDPVTPIDHQISGNVVKFPFDEPFGRGMYRVIVHQSRIYRASDGEPIALTVDTDADGEDEQDWRGWQFQVLDETTSQPRPGNQRTVTRGRDRPKVDVFLDNERVPSGSSELSGEVLTVESTGSAQVSMEVETLLPEAPESMYECFLAEKAESKEVDHETVHVRHYASVGPVGKMKWAHYHGTPTVGRLIANADGKPKIGIPVVRPVKRPGNDPLLTYEETTESPSNDHENTYKIVRYCAEPQTPGVGVDTYRSASIIGPETINDEHNTPATNPRLYPDAATYKDDADDLPSEAMTAGVFDLPLNSVVRVKVNGRVRWWGQTRMLPAMVSPRDVDAEIDDLTVETRAAKTKLLRRIWKASMEALELWSGRLPTDQAGDGVVVSTMRDYVLTRIAMGSTYQEGVQGEVSGSQGGQDFSAQGDRAMRRRLHALAQRLKNGKANAPIMPEDKAPGAHATVGAEAGLSFETGVGRERTECLIPTYNAMNYYPLDRHRRDLWLQFY